MVVAHLLHPHHEIVVFEANDYIGGHTHTVRATLNGKSYAVDTGFIVYNELTYPHFTRLLQRLDVESQPSSMSFSLCNRQTGLEYNGTTLNSLFAQRRNLFRPSFYRMLRDILRFNREAGELLNDRDRGQITLDDYLNEQGYSQEFVEHYLIPMGAAIWSADPSRFRSFPASYFVRFFHNHGMLSVNDRPQWRTIKGGSWRYVEKLTQPYRERVRLNCAVQWVRRNVDCVEVKPATAETEMYDRVIFATHSDQALRLLKDVTLQEREILDAIPYQKNDVVLHTDASLLPCRRRAWASWNYDLVPEERGGVTMTYNMNILQNLQAEKQFCVTLNRTDAINPDTILDRFTYHHPLYTSRTFVAQQRWGEISGVNRTHYCGAYWGYGFHEDGVKSALAVARQFGTEL